MSEGAIAAYGSHPLAEIFPLMVGKDIDSLAGDIRSNGLRQPIVLLDGMILDGRNRYRACISVDVTPAFETYSGDDPLKFVISLNLSRRHLDESQRAMVAAKIANIQGPGRQPDNAPIGAISQDSAGELLNVSRRSVQRANDVIRSPIKELAREVESGGVSVSAAATVARMPEAEQREVVARGKTEILAAAKAFKAVDAESKKRARLAKESALAAATLAASEQIGTKLYGVISADPPWRFEPYSRETGMDRAADNHYPTMTTDTICDMTVPSAEDCVLFLWATAPMLPDALRVMNAWGFTYKSHVVWVKDRIGTGYWARNKHELLLIGTRGSIPAPSPGTQFISAIEAVVGQHSAKPAVFVEQIETMFPSLARLEMFCRSPREGWDSWGNETLDGVLAGADVMGVTSEKPASPALQGGEDVRDIPIAWTPIACQRTSRTSWDRLPRAAMSIEEARQLEAAGHLQTKTKQDKGLLIFMVKAR